MTKTTVLLRERKAVLDKLDLSLEACIRLLAIAIDRLVQKGLTEAEWEVSDQVLTIFPDDLRAHFRRGRGTEASAKASARRRNPATANS